MSERDSSGGLPGQPLSAGTQTPCASAQQPRASVLVSCAILLVLMLVLLAPLVWWADVAHGQRGVFAAIGAWLLCTLAALVALLLSVAFADTPHALAANLGTMLLRMGVPLVSLTLLPGVFPVLKETGFVQCLLISYLMALVIETALAVRHVVPTGKSIFASEQGGGGQNTVGA